MSDLEGLGYDFIDGDAYAYPETSTNAEGSGDTKLSMSSLEERVREILEGSDALLGDTYVTELLQLITDEKQKQLKFIKQIGIPFQETDNLMYASSTFDDLIAELKDQRRGE